MKKRFLLALILVFCVSILIAEEIYVPDDYPTIQLAVNAANSGDVIIIRPIFIYPFAYEENVNLDNFQEGYLIIRSTNPQDPNVVENTVVKPANQNTPTFLRTTSPDDSYTSITISGLTISDGSTAIRIYDIFWPTYFFINYCVIENNVYGIMSEAFYPINVDNSILRDNSIIAITSTHNWVENRECIIISNSLVSSNGNGLGTDLDMNIENCTIDNTYTGINNGYGTSTIINSIIYGNSTQIVNDHGTVNVSYSDIQGGWQGTGNIEDDPLFNDDYTLSWNEEEKSPCIDTGDPESPLDPDGTRADMGAYYHPHEIKTYEFPDLFTLPDAGWKWLCFDILDITMTGDNNTVDPLLDPIRDDLMTGTCIQLGTGFVIEFHYEDPYWITPDHEITSPQGYKFRTRNLCWFDISGFRCEPGTTLPVLTEMDNWIGYFLEKTQHVYDAFDGYLDNIHTIQAQHWSVKYDNGWPDVPYTLSPGDMVVVECDEDIGEFRWSIQEQRESYIIEEPQSFSYEEESDYIPIYMQLDPEDLPTEIGALINGECQGATVVQDTSAQICAYILESQGSSLEFEFYYGGRSENKVIREYYVYDPETSRTEKGSILVENNRDCYYVSFKDEPASKPVHIKLEASNYPNPFNPVTTISYSLPNESEISLTIYNIKGQKVKELIKGTQATGSYNVSWDGKDESGKDVTSGIYFYKLRTHINEIIRKMLLLK
jgi:hypothetical protein